MKRSAVEAALTKVQRLMRVRSKPEDIVAHWAVPSEIASETMLGLTRPELLALNAAEQALMGDLSFEHLGDSARERVWAFACKSALVKPKTDLVPAFVAEQKRDIEVLSCYVAVDHLKVSSELAFHGVRFLPLDSEEIPRHRLVADHLTQKPIGSVAVVEVEGTDPNRMVARANERVEHALRVLRIALREHHSINDRQLRFRRGRGYSLAGELTGWDTHSEAAWELELRQELLELAAQVEVSRLPLRPTTDIEKRALVAVRWMERAWFTGEPVDALLFLFFALEALVGDAAEGQKAHLVAFRQTLLSNVVTGGFPNPNRTLYLYDEVRSNAVHGEAVDGVDWDLVGRFAGTVRWTLQQYLRFARDQSITRRSDLLRTLDAHPSRQGLIEWLRAHAGPWWTEYLDGLERPDPAAAAG